MLSTIARLPAPSMEDGIKAQDKAMMITRQTQPQTPSLQTQPQAQEENNCDIQSIPSLQEEEEDEYMSDENVDEMQVDKLKPKTEPIVSITEESSSLEIKPTESITAIVPVTTSPDDNECISSNTEAEETIKKVNEEEEEINMEITLTSTPPLEITASASIPTTEVSTITTTEAATLPQPMADMSLSSSRRGLRNLGNTCYLNSAIQMLFSLENGFVSDLFQHSQRHSQLASSVEKLNKQKSTETTQEVTNDKDNSSSSTGKKTFKQLFTGGSSSSSLSSSSKKQQKQFLLRDALIQVGRDMMSSDKKTSGAVDPSILKTAMDKKTPQFIGYRQHDSHEFLASLLDMLHEEVKIIEEEKKVPSKKNKKKKKRKSALMKKLSPLFRAGKRVSSFSQLDAKAVEDLLHSKTDDLDASQSSHHSSSSKSKKEAAVIKPQKTWASIVLSSSSTSSSKKPSLAGGRAAVTSTSTMIESTSRSTMDFEQKHEKNDTEIEDKDEIMEDIQRNNENDEEAFSNTESSSENEGSDVDDADNDDNVDAGEDSESGPNADVNRNDSPSQTISSACTFNSFVDSHFCAEVRVTLTCDSCCYSRSHKEMYRHLSIDVGCEEDVNSPACVEEGLKKFFAPEKREIKCEKCFFETATQTMKLIRLPNALLLHFKRFIVEWSPTYNVTYRKNQSAVEYSEQLNLSEYCAVDVSLPRNHHQLSTSPPNSNNNEGILSQPPSISYNNDNNNDDNDEAGSDDDQSTTSTSSTTSSSSSIDTTSTSICDEEKGRYTIKSVVHHIGSTASCGHYTADVLIRSKENGEKRWQRCNDSMVSSYTDPNEVITGKQYQKTAYMVMYELVY